MDYNIYWGIFLDSEIRGFSELSCHLYWNFNTGKEPVMKSTRKRIPNREGQLSFQRRQSLSDYRIVKPESEQVVER